MSATKHKMTHAEHQVNHLRKQVAGHQRIIADLQEALKIERDRQMWAEAQRKGALMAGEIMETIARAAVAELPEEARARWLAMMPALGKETTDGTDTTR